MKKILIIKQGVVTNQAEFPSDELLQQWLDSHKSMGTFGSEAIYQDQPIIITPAVYEDVVVVDQEAVTEQRELLDAQGNSFNPAQFETVEISPRITHIEQRLVSEAVYEMEQILIKEAVLDEQGVEIEPAQYEQRQKLAPVLIQPASYEVLIDDLTLEKEQQAINKEALKYLADTDWLIIRELDEGTPCPVEVKAERAAARARIVR